MASRLGLKLTLAVLPAVVILAACGGPAATPTTAPAKPAATTAPAAPAATKPAAAATTAPAATKPAAAPAATTGAAAPGGAGNVAAGQTVFQQNCNGCHPNGDAGVGPALKGRNLPTDRIRTQVRNGGGQMPPFPENRISEQQLTDLVAYVQSLR